MPTIELRDLTPFEIDAVAGGMNLAGARESANVYDERRVCHSDGSYGQPLSSFWKMP